MWLKLYQLCHLHHLRLYGRAIIAVVVAVILLIAGAIWMSQPRLVLVDMVRAIQVPSAMLARSTMNDAAQAKAITRFATLLPQVIKAYGEAHHVTVVGAHVLVSQGVVDITNTIIQQTLTRLKSDA